MKYVITKSGQVKTTSNKGHHRELAKKVDIASAGRYNEKTGRVYSKSMAYNIKPAKGDAKKVRRAIQ